MAFEILNQRLLPKRVIGNEPIATVIINKSGSIKINKEGAARLEIVFESDKISFAINKDTRTILVYKDNENGFEFQKSEFKKRRRCLFIHQLLANKIIDSLSIKTPAPHVLKFMPEPEQFKTGIPKPFSPLVKYWPLIVKPKV